MKQSNRYKLITDASEEPITTAEAKTHLRVTSSNDDTYISGLIKAARQQAEKVMWGAVISQTWDLYFDTFPTELQIWKVPITAITSIKYQDEDNAEQTLATSDYSTSIVSTREPARIKILNAPSTYSDGYDSMVIRFVTGNANAAAVPEIIKQAIKIQVALWYEVRQPVITGTQVNMIGGSVEEWFRLMLQDYTITGL